MPVELRFVNNGDSVRLQYRNIHNREWPHPPVIQPWTDVPVITDVQAAEDDLANNSDN